MVGISQPYFLAVSVAYLTVALIIFEPPLIWTSKKSIPAKLIYVGNFANAICPPKEFIPHSKENIVTVSWKQFDETFETKMLKRYCGHNLRELSIYTEKSI